MRFKSLPLVVALMIGFGSLAVPPGVAHAQIAVRQDVQAWNRMLPHLAHAEKDSAAALGTAVQKLDGFFAQAKEGVKPFIDDVFSFEAKTEMAVGAVGQLFTGLGNAFSSLNEGLGSPLGDLGYSTASDRFHDYVDARFTHHVFSSSALKKEVQEALSGYRSTLANVESRLATDLRDTNGGTPIRLPRGLSAPALETLDGGDSGEAVDAAAVASVTAQQDVVVGLGMFAGSWILATYAGGQMGVPMDYSATGILASLGLGGLVDSALGSAVSISGYDPRSTAASRVEQALDKMRASLLDGDAEAVKDHTKLVRLADRHPDEPVRVACETAIKALEGHANLGVRQLLTRAHAVRARERMSAVYRQLFGVEPKYPTDAAVAKGEPAAELIAWANKLATQYGGEEK